MNSDAEVVTQFREAIADCKSLYIRAARASLEDCPDADAATQRNMIRRMVDLHKGLLIKIYATVATADSRWSRKNTSWSFVKPLPLAITNDEGADSPSEHCKNGSGCATLATSGRLTAGVAVHESRPMLKDH